MSQKPPQNYLQDEARLEILRKLDLLDTPAVEALDRLTRLASKITGSPVSLVSIVDADRQFFKSLFGLPEPYASKRETPLSHSFCQHVVTSNEPLVVEDAREVDFLKDNLAIPDLSVIGYLGMPLTTSEGVGLGSFCIIDNKPRKWTEAEVEIVKELAISAMTEIELQAQVKARAEAEEHLIKRNAQYRRVYTFAASTLEHMAEIAHKDADPRELLVYIEQMKQQLARL